MLSALRLENGNINLHVAGLLMIGEHPQCACIYVIQIHYTMVSVVVINTNVKLTC